MYLKTSLCIHDNSWNLILHWLSTQTDLVLGKGPFTTSSVREACLTSGAFTHLCQFTCADEPGINQDAPRCLEIRVSLSESGEVCVVSVTNPDKPLKSGVRSLNLGEKRVKWQNKGVIPYLHVFDSPLKCCRCEHIRDSKAGINLRAVLNQLGV